MDSKLADTFLFSSEAFGEGNADKLCDYISDAVVDACVEQDPDATVSIDVSAKAGLICVIGDITLVGSQAIDIEYIVRKSC